MENETELDIFDEEFDEPTIEEEEKVGQKEEEDQINSGLEENQAGGFEKKIPNPLEGGAGGEKKEVLSPLSSGPDIAKDNLKTKGRLELLESQNLKIIESINKMVEVINTKQAQPQQPQQNQPISVANNPMGNTFMQMMQFLGGMNAQSMQMLQNGIQLGSGVSGGDTREPTEMESMMEALPLLLESPVVQGIIEKVVAKKVNEQKLNFGGY